MDKRVSLENITVGPLATNCYLLLNQNKKSAILIDAGAEPLLIKRRISKSGASLEAIILTHGHFDHIGGLSFLEAPIFIHQEDERLLKDNDKNLSEMLGFNFCLPKNRDIRRLNDGQILKIAGLEFRIIHTPGHTPGSISIVFEDIVFSGDALFAGSIGRTDIPYASSELLIESIKNKLLTLPLDTKVYPGHGPATTIGEEKKNNPYLA